MNKKNFKILSIFIPLLGLAYFFINIQEIEVPSTDRNLCQRVYRIGDEELPKLLCPDSNMLRVCHFEGASNPGKVQYIHQDSVSAFSQVRAFTLQLCQSEGEDVGENCDPCELNFSLQLQ